MLPCTATEEMYMVLAVITMLLLAKRKTGANSTWTFHQDHPPQGKYLLLCHYPSHEPNDFNPTFDGSEMLPDFSSEPDASMYNLSTPQQRVLFPLELFEDMDNEQVTKVPYNINGNHCYTIEVHSGKWHKAQEDGRWFLMQTSTVRHSNLVRKSGKCMGSFVCNNDNCPKFTSGKGRNTYAFTNIGIQPVSV